MYRIIFLTILIVIGFFNLNGQSRTTTTTTTTTTTKTTTIRQNSKGSEKSSSTTIVTRKNGEIISIENDSQKLSNDETVNNSLDRQNASTAPTDQKVLMCFGSAAYTYHKKLCDGIANCGAKIDSVYLSFAKENNRNPCGTCYSNIQN